MKKKNDFNGFFGIIALAVVLIFTLIACGDPGGGGDPVKYTVTFDANGGTVSPSSIQVESGKTVTSLPTPSKTSGDTYFWGWFTKGGTGGDWGSLFIATTPVTGDITVYARWGSTAPTQHTITFNADGGTVSPTSKQVISGDQAGDLPTPTKSNNTFGGWYTAINGGGSVLTSVTTVTGNITVYAKWTIIEAPVARVETRQLTDANWRAILTEINVAGKDVNLDLSACTRSDASTGGGLRSDGTFDPIYDFSTGKNRIVSLILPDAAISIVDSTDTEYPTFRGFSSLENVSASMVTTIGDEAFNRCTNLTSANFQAVTVIKGGAFNRCTNLTSANFPAVTVIKGGAFSRCTSLTDVNFPVVTTIGENAFANCTSLTDVNFPVVTTIDGEAFENCTSLTDVNFPVVTTIGGLAFSNCTKLVNVSLPVINNIGYLAFYNCTSLTSVSFPAATDIGSAFAGCTKLASFTLTGTGSLSTIENGKVLVRNDTELVAYPSASGNITLNNITSIGDGAFRGCTSLTSVSFPAATYIGSGAFSNCNSLSSASFPKVTEIATPHSFFDTAEVFAYTGTTALTITLGPNAPTLGCDMFKEYTYSAKIVTVMVPAGATGYGTIPSTYSGTDTTENWGNGFRGGGWDGTGFDHVIASGINRNITLTVQYLE
jgi:uncharacterized repeat protein (TIGR02543 family)